MRFPGENLELKSVLDELRTISMWGDSRTVIVEEADDFVSRFRSGLENYVAAPAKKSTLILVIKSWPKTTRLAKAVAKTHLAVDCSPFKPEKLIPWASETAKRDHGKQLSRNTASLLIELVGTGFGTVVQEIVKLATYVGDRDRITEEDIRAVVGGWATQTTFEMLGQVYSGRLGRALELLDKLLSAGEPPQKIMGGISFSIRKLANAVEGSRHGVGLNASLKNAGVFFREIRVAESYLRRISRVRAERILPNLIAVEGNLKGQSTGSRGLERLELEQLLVRLSGALPGEMT